MANTDKCKSADPRCRLRRSLIRVLVWLAAGLMLPIIVRAMLPQQSQRRSPDDVTISVQSQLVQVYFTVTEGTRRVMGLQAPDFKLAEDGKPAPVDRLDSQTVPLQIALLLDLSESMRPSLPMTQDAAVSFVEALDPGDRVTLVLFNSDIRCIPQVTDDREPILDAIRNSRPQGNTRLYDALLFAMKYLDGKPGRRAIVCFSDGEDTADSSSLKVVTTAAAQYGCPIYTIGAGEGLRSPGLQHILRQLASVNSGRAFFVKDLQKLRAAFAEAASELRSAYVLNYYTQVPSDGAWHNLNISVANPLYKVHARRGFYARSAGVNALSGDHAEAVTKKNASTLRTHSAAAKQAAKAAESEVVMTAPAARQPDMAALRGAIASEVPANTPRGPVFKVESRFVEVPVLVESATGKDLPSLGAKDFRVYEDDSLREIAFFAGQAQNQTLGALRASALKNVQAAGLSLAAQTDDGLLLGRYCLVLDDTMSETGAFLRGKQAAEEIIRTYDSPLRPLSLQFTSQTEMNLSTQESTEAMLLRLHRANQHANRDLTTNDGTMSVYEAFLIERGDKEAVELAELRLASSMHLTYKNDLGEVDGEELADPQSIQTSIEETSRSLVAENYDRTSRTIDGLRMAVNALSSYSGSYPRVILFISTGFVLGRDSGRGDASQTMSDVIALARRNGVRIFTIDSSGLTVQESLGIGANASFLARNPFLDRILQTHASAWQFERESSLSQPAADTGGRFLHNTNDLAAAANVVMRATGQLYYLGYLSKQPADARFHRIRVTTSLGSKVRVHARPGYFADQQDKSADSASADTAPVTALLERADQARKSGNVELLADSLERLGRRLPNRPEIWLSLGSAEMALNHPELAVKALQKAFVLAPEDRETNLQLSRALLAAGNPDSAADTLERLTQRTPGDAQTLLQLGRIYEAGSRVLEAHQTYRRILDLTLAPPLDVYLLLARTAIGLNRTIEAGLFIRDYLARGGDEASVRSLPTFGQISSRR